MTTENNLLDIMPISAEIMPIAEMPTTTSVKKNKFDNTFAKAQNLGKLTEATITAKDFVGKTDFQDYYKFEINSKQNNLVISLDNLSDSVIVTLFDKNKEKIDSLLFSPEDENNKINYDELDNGLYYIRVEADNLKSKANYNLSLSNNLDNKIQKPADFTNNLNQNEDNDRKSANNIGILNQKSYVIGGNLAISVGDDKVKQDETDFYKFELASAKKLSFTIDSRLSADNLHLFDKYGNEILLKVEGTTATTEVNWLDAGTYSLQVSYDHMAIPMIYPFSATYDYNISVKLDEPNYGYNFSQTLDNKIQNADDSFNTANVLNLGKKDYAYLNFEGTLGSKIDEKTTDTHDFYKFELSNSQSIYLGASGIYSDSVKLYDANFSEITNITEYQQQPIAIPYDSLTASSVTMPSPTPFGSIQTGELKAGTYYLEIADKLQYQDISRPAETNYQISMSVNPATKYNDNQTDYSADNSIQTANVFDLKDQYSTILGTLGSKSGNNRGINDSTDFYKISLDKNTVLNFNASSVSLKGLHLFDSKGKELDLNDISEQYDYLPNARTTESKILTVSSDMRYMNPQRVQSNELNSGTYYLEVDNISDSNSYYGSSNRLDYSVSIEKKNPLIIADNSQNPNADDQISGANLIKFDENDQAKFQGALNFTRGVPTATNDTTDYYKISLDHASKLNIKLNDVNGLDSVRLFKANGEEISLKSAPNYFYPMPILYATDGSQVTQNTSINLDGVDLEKGEYYLQILDTKTHSSANPLIDSTTYTVTIDKVNIPELSDNVLNPLADDEMSGANLIALKPQEISNEKGIVTLSKDYSTAEFRGTLYATDGSNGKKSDNQDFYKIDLKNTNNLYINVNNVDFDAIHLYDKNGTEVPLHEQMIMYARAENAIQTTSAKPIESLVAVDKMIMPPFGNYTNAHAYVNKLTEGTYYLEIRNTEIPTSKTYENTISYQANISTTKVADIIFNDNQKDVLADNSIKTANKVDLNQQSTSIIGQVSYVAGYPELKSDSTDFYKISLNADSDMTLSFIDKVNGVNLSAVHIYDEQGKDITQTTFKKPINGIEMFDSNWLETNVLNKGTYYIEVQESGMHTKQYPYKSITNYELSINLGNAQAINASMRNDNQKDVLADNQISGANTPNLNTNGSNVILGSLINTQGYFGKISDNKDLYKIELPFGNTSISAKFNLEKSSGLSLDSLRLLDKNGDDITANSSVQSLLPMDEILTKALPSGTYFLEVADTNDFYKSGSLSFYERPYHIDLTLNKQENIMDGKPVEITTTAMPKLMEIQSLNYASTNSKFTELTSGYNTGILA